MNMSDTSDAANNNDDEIEVEEFETVRVDEDGNLVVDDVIVVVDAHGHVLATDETIVVLDARGDAVLDETVSIVGDDGQMHVLEEDVVIVETETASEN